MHVKHRLVPRQLVLITQPSLNHNETQSYVTNTSYLRCELAKYGPWTWAVQMDDELGLYTDDQHGPCRDMGVIFDTRVHGSPTARGHLRHFVRPCPRPVSIGRGHGQWTRVV